MALSIGRSGKKEKTHRKDSMKKAYEWKVWAGNHELKKESRGKKKPIR